MMGLEGVAAVAAVALGASLIAGRIMIAGVQARTDGVRAPSPGPEATESVALAPPRSPSGSPRAGRASGSAPRQMWGEDEQIREFVAWAYRADYHTLTGDSSNVAGQFTHTEWFAAYEVWANRLNIVRMTEGTFLRLLAGRREIGKSRGVRARGKDGMVLKLETGTPKRPQFYRLMAPDELERIAAVEAEAAAKLVARQRRAKLAKEIERAPQRMRRAA